MDGLVERRPGIGTVVVAEIRQFPIFECSEPTIGVTSTLALVETCDVPITAYLASRFGEATRLLRMSEFLIKVNDRTVGVFSRYGLAPAPALEEPAPVLPPTHLSWYRRIHEEPPGDIQVVVEATTADERTARLLDVEEGHPLLVRETLYFDRQHNPAELHIAYFDSRKAAFKATVADVT